MKRIEMIDININELRRLTQAATPGPWYVGTGTYEGRNIYSVVSVTDAEGFTYQPVVATAEDNEVPQWDANIRLIAACNPVAISELLDRLEAAEKSDAESIAMYRKARDERDALRAKIEAMEKEREELHTLVAVVKKQAYSEYVLRVKKEEECTQLRVKIERMEQQEPVAHVWRCDNGHIHGSCEQALPIGAKLYALPTPSVPTALLVAVADLVAQMEIVSRVGFVDTPNDRDSCAAFCVAEGAWLELMGCVESLASALAAAPEVKP